jgi:hypothetical protein
MNQELEEEYLNQLNGDIDDREPLMQEDVRVFAHHDIMYNP